MTRSRAELRSTARVALATALVLSLPLAAMQITDEVAWGVADFVVAGALLAAAGVALELATTTANDFPYRAAVGLALAAGLLLVWANLAVGVIGEPDEPANLMYFGVVAIGVVGACIARFRPNGMARVLLATALAQALAAAIALVAGEHGAPPSSVPELLALNGLFVALFAGSAWLFRRAAHRRRAASTGRTVG